MRDVVAMIPSNVKDAVIICDNCNEYNVSPNGYYGGINSTCDIQYRCMHLRYTAVVPSKYDFVMYVA